MNSTQCIGFATIIIHKFECVICFGSSMQTYRMQSSKYISVGRKFNKISIVRILPGFSASDSAMASAVSRIIVNTHRLSDVPIACIKKIRARFRLTFITTFIYFMMKNCVNSEYNGNTMFNASVTYEAQSYKFVPYDEMKNTS